MVNWKIIKNFGELTWQEKLECLDAVGLWHYTRTIPDEKDYEVEYVPPGQGGTTISNGIKEQHQWWTVKCARTRTCFRFDEKWRAHFNYMDEQGVDRTTRPVEGQLSSAFTYVGFLLEKGYITFDTKQN